MQHAGIILIFFRLTYDQVGYDTENQSAGNGSQLHLTEGNCQLADAGNEDCQNAVKAYAYGIKKYIGAYTAAMGGVDAIVFGGGIGRNSASVRAASLCGLECLGVKLDAEKNINAKGGDDISSADSKVRIYIVDTNEEIIVARKAQALLKETIHG